LRTQAQKIAKPDGKFEMRTPARVAGVVGTDFFIEYANDSMNVIVFEGQVKVCNLGGVCVLAKAGQMTFVHSGNNTEPAPPQQATLDQLVTASNNTVSGLGTDVAVTGAGVGTHLGILGTIGIVVGAVGTGLGVGLTRGGGPTQRGCKPNPATGQCG
jgi:FecR protein